MRGQDYRKVLSNVIEYRETETFNLFVRMIEERISDILESWSNEPDLNEVIRLQGSFRELRGILNDLYPKTKKRAMRDSDT